MGYLCRTIQMRSCGCQKGPIGVSKETYWRVKSDLSTIQKRPTCAKDSTWRALGGNTYVLACQERHIGMSKETFWQVESDLVACQKRRLVSKQRKLLHEYHTIAHRDADASRKPTHHTHTHTHTTYYSFYIPRSILMNLKSF